jgi:tetratricopeptide (TPR) repeat protein
MNRIHARSRFPLFFAALLSCAAGHAETPLPVNINSYACGPIANAFGPYDYRTVDAATRHKVEDYHFTPAVEQAVGGATGGFGGDIDYTLRVFPNNPRALLALSKYALRHHQEMIPGAHWTAECYYERAFRLAPNDPMPRLIYAIYLKDRKRMAEVKAQLDEAERLRGVPTNADLDYNLGILYTDIGAYDKAAVAAQRAYALGAPLPALMNRLKKVGKWQEPKSPPPASSQSQAPTQSASPSAAATPPPSPRESGDRAGEVN